MLVQNLGESYRGHDLELPDGRSVAQVRRFDLFRELKRLGVRVEDGATHAQMAAAYRDRILTVRRELAPAEPSSHGGNVPQAIMRDCVAFLERQAAT